MSDLPAVTPLDDTPELREVILKACLYLSDQGFFLGTWGNISVRVSEGFLVTPSRVDYDTQTVEDLVLVGLDGKVVRGDRLPSSEADMHRVLLKRRPDLGCFVHVHSTMLSAFAAAQHSIPACVEDIAQIIGGEVKCAPYTEGGRNSALGDVAADAMGPECAAVLLANHGAVIGGRDLSEAIVACEIMEKGAAIVLNAQALGGVKPLSDEQVREERHKFLFKYGKV